MNLNINDFNGPLDVLLKLVKKHQMDIYEIDIRLIIDEYIEFINKFDQYDLDNKSEYLVMASELIHLKSKLLLGLDEEESDDSFEINSEEELRQRILDYEKYQNVAEDFRNLESKRQDFFTKVPENLKEYAEDPIISETMDIKDLINALLEMQQRKEYKKPKNTKITRKELSIKDKTNYIRNVLTQKKKVEFFDLINDVSKEELVITLLSILEMSKNKEVVLSQKQNFSKIYVEVLHE